MPRLRLLTDEHVPGVAVTALRGDGFSVETARLLFGDRTDDRPLLEAAADRDRVLLTNDRDFARLHQRTEHAGIVLYTDQDLSPSDFVRGLVRLDRHFAPEDMRDELQWLDRWVE